MTRSEFLSRMLKKGKITQGQIDKINNKALAKERYIKDKAKMTKVEMQSVLDILI